MKRTGGRSDIIFVLTLLSVYFSSSDGSIDSFFMPSTPKSKYIFSDVDVEISFLNGNIDDIDNGFNSPNYLPREKSLEAVTPSFVPTFCSHSYEAVHPLVDASKSSSLHSPFLLSLSQLITPLLSLSLRSD